ncbi:hypothetical protein [Nocardia sp. NPDC005366]|uniref:hypothetical protein n=1 Tax=Nocardia sp. NPDC005366 TaxID=3156878 RepID=UPI0033A6EAE0
MSTQLVVVGFDEIVARKYLPCLISAINEGHLSSYSIIDLESEREVISARLRGVPIAPRHVHYLPNPCAGQSVSQDLVAEAFGRVTDGSAPIRAYIATEVKAHESYLRFCVDNGIGSLVEKPVLAPLRDGRFEAPLITPIMRSLIASAARKPEVRHSVMTLSRYHRVYNDRVIAELAKRVRAWQAPVTSLHLRCAGGVWNRQEEYEFRDDHPYKFGYGMMMHGAYHYIDLVVQAIQLNRTALPDHRLRFQVGAITASPADQHLRIPISAAARIGDSEDRWPDSQVPAQHFGETDVTAMVRLVDTQSGRTVTMGTLAFEQTTPSVRNWTSLPAGTYNKNGRTSSVDFEVGLSTLFSAHTHCYDIPTSDPDKIDAFARITTRANATLYPGEDYVTTEEHHGVFHSDSNRALMTAWLRGSETRSLLADHLLPMQLIEAILIAAANPGRLASVDLP